AHEPRRNGAPRGDDPPTAVGTRPVPDRAPPVPVPASGEEDLLVTVFNDHEPGANHHQMRRRVDVNGRRRHLDLSLDHLREGIAADEENEKDGRLDHVESGPPSTSERGTSRTKARERQGAQNAEIPQPIGTIGLHWSRYVPLKMASLASSALWFA